MNFNPETNNVREGLSPKVSVFSYIPTAENKLVWLNMELMGRLPGFRRRFLLLGAMDKSLAIFGEHEDDTDLAEKKRRWIDRWIEQLAAINALFYNLHIRIEIALEKIDLELEIIDNKIEALEDLGHNEEADALRQDRKKLKDLREDYEEAHDDLHKAENLEELEKIDSRTKKLAGIFAAYVISIFDRKKPAADFSHEAHIRPETQAREEEAAQYYSFYEQYAQAHATKSAPVVDEDEDETEKPAQEPV